MDRTIPWSPKTARAHAEQLSAPSAWRTWRSLFLDWGTIAACVTFSRYTNNWAIYAAAVPVIAARQHALLVLMHEGAHGHFFRSRLWNDRVCNWLCAWPLGVSTERYRAHHWEHHRHTNTDQDPDWNRKSRMPSWQFPKSRAKFWSDLKPYLFGLGFAEMIFAVRALGGLTASPLRRALHATLFFGGLTFALGNWAVAQYWLVPYFFVLPLLMKVRSVVEHLALPQEHPLNGTRNIVASSLERFFFGPHWNNLHLVHHLYPNVPWHNVPALQAKLKEDPLYCSLGHENTSYFLPSARPVYRDLVRGPIPAPAEKAA